MAIIDKIKVGTTTYDIEPAQTEEFSTLTFNNSGSGGASGTFFDGTAAKTVSYNTVGAAAATHYHSHLTTPGDNRSVATTPETYNSKLQFSGLKTASVIGLPSSVGAYAYTVGLRGWSDSSGGNAHELGFTNKGIYYRNGASTWGNWCSLATMDTSGNISATSFTASSDKRLKENIIPYNCESSILNLPVYKYNFIADNTKQEHIGCLAQDLQKICPEIVKEDDNGYLSINESKLVYLLLMEVKELKAEIEKLKEGNN